MNMSKSKSNEIRKKFDVLPSIEVISAEFRNIPKGEGYKSRLITWLTQKGVLGIYKNIEQKWDVIFNAKGARSVLSHGTGDRGAALLEYVPELIKNGIYLETTNKTVKLKSHTFAAKATIDGILYAVSYIIREDMNGKRYYDHSLTKITALDQVNDQAPIIEDTQVVSANNLTPAECTSINILKKYLSVNNKDAKSTPKNTFTSNILNTF